MEPLGVLCELCGWILTGLVNTGHRSQVCDSARAPVRDYELITQSRKAAKTQNKNHEWHE